MATNMPPNPPTNPFALFDAVATKILRTFDPLIERLVARRDALLHKLTQIRDDYTTKETTREAAFQELEETRQHLHKINIKVNRSISIHQKATDVFQQGLEGLVIPTTFPCPFFNCPTLETLENFISEFGEVTDWQVPDYSKKLRPVLTAGKKGKGVNKLSAAGICVDDANKRAYIADCDNSRIQVMSYEGKFVKNFGQQTLMKPYGIAVTKDEIFVTDRLLHSLFQFSKKDFKFNKRTGTKGNREGQLTDPYGVSADRDGDVYVAESGNNRVSIFSNAMQFKKWLGVGKLNFPLDVGLTNECIVVLDWSPNCITFFSRDGTIRSSCVRRGEGRDCFVFHPWFFCLDPADNIIISDTYHHAISVFSKTGEHIHTFGKKGNERGELNLPFGVSISLLGIIFVVSDNLNYSLQCF